MKYNRKPIKLGNSNNIGALPTELSNFGKVLFLIPGSCACYYFPSLQMEDLK